MAAPLTPLADIEISDTDSLNPVNGKSPIEESIVTAASTSTAAEDEAKTHSAETSESIATKDCLQVTGDGEIVMDEENSAIIKRKKLSLTLPLLNIVDTGGAAHTSGDAVATEATSPNGTVAVSATSSCSRTKKIYDSDDTFIQTIFSQTIKSTTVTPTDDDPSYAFEDFHGTRIRGSVSSAKSDSLLTDDTPVEKLEMPIDGMSPSTIAKTSFFDKRLSETSEILLIEDTASPPSDKPTETFAYFHQTIDEDDVADGEIAATDDDDAAAAAVVDIHSPADACLDEFIDLPVETHTNTEPLTNATCADANATNTTTTRTASYTQAIAQITLSSPSPVLEEPPEPDSDDCSNANANNNTNASNTEQGNDASEQINAADAISSYDDEHTETEQNNTRTSSNSSLHVSSETLFLFCCAA